MNINHKKISYFIINVLKSIGVPKGDSELLAESLVGTGATGGTTAFTSPNIV